MNYPWLASRRHQRRLPHVQRPPRCKQLTFWPTYRGAVDWLRRNHGVIDKALGLLEIYPSLIQDASLDSLWQFIAPFFTKAVEKNRNKGTRSGQSVFAKTESQTRKPSRFSTSSRQVSAHSTNTRMSTNLNNGKAVSKGTISPIETMHVPIISITYASDDQDSKLPVMSPDHFRDEGSAEMEQTPRVYMCCLCNYQTGEEKLHRQVLHTLQHDFYVRSGPCMAAKHDVNCDDMRGADVCVFVLDDLSLNTPTYFKSLCAAWTFDIPIVFLKDSEYSLPARLPDIILQHNLGLHSSDLSRASTPASSVTPPINLCSTSRASSTSGFRNYRSQHRTQRDLRDSDMVLYLLDGYRKALVFDESRQQDCGTELKNIIHTLLGTAKRKYFNKTDLASKGSNTLHPLSRRQCSSQRSRATLLETPKALPMISVQQDTGLYTDEDDEDNDSVFSRCSSQVSINSPSPTFDDASLSENPLIPHPHSHREEHTTASKCHFPSTTKSFQVMSTPSLLSTHSSGRPLSTKSESSRSFSYLHQLQRQLQQDRAAFLSSSSSIDDAEVLDNFDGRQTTYLVCSKSPLSPNREPRLIKWPPSKDEENEQREEVNNTSSDNAFSDSPLSFRDLDLSIVINKPYRGSDTPDSDGSSTF